MDKSDQDLNRWLDSYRVENADEALLESIILEARQRKQDAKVVTFPKAAGQGGWFKNAGAMAATALCGFWLGTASLQEAGTVLSSSDDAAINIDTVILGPQNQHEVLL